MKFVNRPRGCASLLPALFLLPYNPFGCYRAFCMFTLWIAFLASVSVVSPSWARLPSAECRKIYTQTHTSRPYLCGLWFCGLVVHFAVVASRLHVTSEETYTTASSGGGVICEIVVDICLGRTLCFTFRRRGVDKPFFGGGVSPSPGANVSMHS